MQKRYHIKLDDRRTTITLDTVLAELLAVKIGISPDDDNAHTVVRDWLESMIKDKLSEETGSRLSQNVRKCVIEEIADSDLMGKVADYRLFRNLDISNLDFPQALEI